MPPLFETTNKQKIKTFTLVCVVQCSKGDGEEGGGVFPCVDQVRESPFGVPVAPQALDEAKPGGKTLDDGAHAVGVGVTHVPSCGEKKVNVAVCRVSPAVIFLSGG